MDMQIQCMRHAEIPTSRPRPTTDRQEANRTYVKPVGLREITAGTGEKVWKYEKAPETDELGVLLRRYSQPERTVTFLRLEFRLQAFETQQF